MSEKKKCFIIQPLTDEYKDRCEETYKPAITKAGLSPYRVDEYYNAEKLKIEVIKDEIENSIVCLADITENNPNVWYEVGFADGHVIPIVLICDAEKRNTLPFDVNQRDTYFYTTKSQGDWEKLQEEITKRLKIAVRQGATNTMKDPTKDSIIHESVQYGKTELYLLKILYYDSVNNSDLAWSVNIRQRMHQLGLNDMDVTDAFTQLKSEGIVTVGITRARDGAHLYSLTQEGKNWCLQNKKLLREVKQ